MNENYTITRQQNYKDYERIMFCLKALGNDSDPAFTHYLHVENGRRGSRLIATDGKRLHFVNLSIKIPAGNYQPVIKDLATANWKVFRKKGRNKLVLLKELKDGQNQFAVFVPVRG